jgi:hypothetical protein
MAFAPTPHPLSTLWSVLALPFGDQTMVWLVLLSFGVLVVLAFRLGEQLFSPWVGLVVALVVLTRPAMQRDTVLGYQDVPFGVLVVWAALLEARRPRRGWPVLAVLAVAGLLRPEAWALAGLYWIYVAPRIDWPQRLRLAGLVAVGPVVWALMDLIVTGDALHSLHGTADLAELADRRRSLSDVPHWTATYYGYSLREPLVVGVPLGLAFAWRFRERFARAAALPLAIAGAMTLVFAINPIFGLPLIGRYIRAPSLFLSVFYGLAVAGWLLLRRDHPERRLWMGVGAAALLLSVVYIPWHVDRLRKLERRYASDGPMYADLRATARAPAVRDAVRECGAIVSADHRPVPYLRYWLGTDPGSVLVRGYTDEPARVVLRPRRSPYTDAFYRDNFPTGGPPAGTERIYANRSWAVYAVPACAPS